MSLESVRRGVERGMEWEGGGEREREGEEVKGVMLKIQLKMHLLAL